MRPDEFVSDRPILTREIGVRHPRCRERTKSAVGARRQMTRDDAQAIAVHARGPAYKARRQRMAAFVIWRSANRLLSLAEADTSNFGNVDRYSASRRECRVFVP